MRADLLERSGAQLSPAGDEHEAPAVAVELVEARERLRQAIANEARSRAPALHQRAHVVGAAPPEEDERRVGEQRLEVRDAEAVRRGLVDEASAAGEEPDREAEVRALLFRRSRSARPRPSSRRGRAGGGTRPRGCGPRSGPSRARRSRAGRPGGASSPSEGSRRRRPGSAAGPRAAGRARAAARSAGRFAARARRGAALRTACSTACDGDVTHYLVRIPR